jgi:hypothetical protein
MYDQHEPKIGPAIIKGEQLGNQALPAVAGNLHGSFLVVRQVDFAAGQQIWAMHCFVESNSPYCLDSFPVEDYSFWDGKHPAVANGGLSPKEIPFSSFTKRLRPATHPCSSGSMGEYIRLTNGLFCP